MQAQPMAWPDAHGFAKQFDLPQATPREIAGEVLRRTLLRSGWCWAWLAIGLVSVVALSAATGRRVPHHHDLNAFTLVIGLQVVMALWRCLGQWLAGPAMLAEAERRSAGEQNP